MTDFNIGHHGHQQAWDYGEKGNISIKHTTGKHTHNAAARDHIQASQSIYKEAYVPPVDNPVLEPHDPNADNTPPKSKPENPNVKFNTTFDKELRNLPASTLRTLNANPQEARAMLKFAYEHPNVPVDPKVRQIVNAMVAKATQQTEKAFNLTSSWKPAPPNTESKDLHIADQYNNNFEQLLEQSFSPHEAKTLTFAHFFPEFRSKLTPEQQQVLKLFEQAAYKETQMEEGFPNNWEMPQDNTNFSDKMEAMYDRSFDQALAKEKDLSPKERRELKTLHRFPNAKVPDREKLMGKLKELNEKALHQTKERFKMPDGHKLKPQSDVLKATINGAFKHHFAKEVQAKLNKGEISPHDAQKLLNSKGVDPAKVPANLHQAYTAARQAAAKSTTNDYGLPETWEPSNTSESGETSSTSGDNTVKNADGTVRVRANAPVNKKGSAANQNQPVDPAHIPVQNRDLKSAAKAINYYSDAVGIARRLIPVYFTGPAVMTAGDSMVAVSDALDASRDCVFAMEEAEARVATKISNGQADSEIEKSKKQLADLKKSMEKPKVFFLFKIFESIPLIGKLMEQLAKVTLWVANILLGGAISMIAQAAGIQPITENPLQMMGVISQAQAEKMDFALQIIAMVVEMAISVLVAQPELIMGEVAMMTAEIAEVGTETAVEVAKDVVEAAIPAVAEGVVEAAAETGAEVTSSVIDEAVEAIAQVAEKSVGSVARVASRQALKAAIKQTISAQIKAAVKNAVKNAKLYARATVRASIKMQVKRFTDAKEFVQALKADPAGTMANLAKTEVANVQAYFVNMFNNFRDLATTGLDGIKDVIEGVKDIAGVADEGASAEKSAARGAGEGAEGATAAEGGAAAEAETEAAAQEMQEQAQVVTEVVSEAKEGGKAGGSGGSEGAGGGEGTEGAGKDGKGVAESDAKGEATAASQNDAMNVQSETKAEDAPPPQENKPPEQAEAKPTEAEKKPEEEVEGKEKPEAEDAGKKEDVNEASGKGKAEEGHEAKGKTALKKTQADDANKVENAGKNQKDAKVDQKQKTEHQQQKDSVEAHADAKKAKETVEKTQKLEEKVQEKLGDFKKTSENASKNNFEERARTRARELEGIDQKERDVQGPLTEAHTRAEENVNEAAKKLIDRDQIRAKLEKEIAKISKARGNEVKIESKAPPKPGSAKEGAKNQKAGSDKPSIKVGPKGGRTGANEIKLPEEKVQDAEDLVQYARKLAKKSEAANQARFQRNWAFMMDIKSYLQNTLQFTTYTVNGIMKLKQADAAMKAAEEAAYVQLMDAYISIEKKSVSALLDNLDSLSGWINDINQQESMYWKKMEIRYIAA